MIVQPIHSYTDRVVVIDYGMSNLQSVCNALNALGCHAEVSSDPDIITSADRIILPGVGAFGRGMSHLREMKLIAPLENSVAQGKPLLGICLGMQLLADESFEHGHHEGLHFIPGSVRRLPASPGIRIPHIGWNGVDHASHSELYREIKNQSDYYFVHSYYFDVVDSRDANGWCDYGGRFAASVGRNKVYGVQFHPEKSHRAGLLLLRNFLLC